MLNKTLSVFLRTVIFAASTYLAVNAVLAGLDKSFSFGMNFVIGLCELSPVLIVGSIALGLLIALLQETGIPHPVVIAVDGTAASGKGTLAKRLANHFGFAHLDSGSLYRLAALTVLEAGGDPSRKADALKAAKRLDPARRDDPALRTETIGRAATQVAKFPAVRKRLHKFQASFMAHPPGGALGSVLDGRDIGTVVAPRATAKLYVDAKPEVRAHRRWQELKSRGIDREEGEILAEILARDAADMSRPISPLKRAADAFLLDTSEMDIDAAFAAALALVSPGVENALKALAKG